MKYIRYGFFALRRNPLFNILIILEIAVILIVGNLTVAAANSRTVLIDPYNDIMSSDGYLFSPGHNKKISLYFDPELILDTLYKELKGDISVTVSYHADGYSVNGPLFDAFKDNRHTKINLYAFDEKIYSKFRLPLKDGRWGSSKRNEKDQIEAVAVVNQKEELKPGDIIPLHIAVVENDSVKEYDKGEMLITGIIDCENYYPEIAYHKSEKQDVRDMYYIQEKSSDIKFLVSAAADPVFVDKKQIGGSAAFITYNSSPTEEQREYNEARLSSNAAQLYKLSSFKARTDSYIFEQYIKMLPILLGVFIIVLAELICSVAMNTKAQLRNYGIYFLCGARFRGCLKISVAYSAIILSAGSVIGAGLFAVLSFSDYAALFEQNISYNNLYISLGIIMFMMIISLLVPFFMVRKASPVSTIKEN